MPGTGGWALHMLSLPVLPESSKVDRPLRLTRVALAPGHPGRQTQALLTCTCLCPITPYD